MSDSKPLISEAFRAFQSEAPDHARAWGELVRSLAGASALDPKTASLAYLAVLAALRIESGVPFHVRAAREAGASRDEVLSAILVGLAPAGHVVTQALPSAIAASCAFMLPVATPPTAIVFGSGRVTVPLLAGGQAASGR